MRKRLGCLHAHYSNIEYIEHALSPFNIELIHFVDPALMYRVTYDEKFQEVEAQRKVKEQIEWISRCKVDAILITCTNYIAMLRENQLSLSIPIIKIDEPYFDYIIGIQKPQIILFTNPETVNGTMRRLIHYAAYHKKSLDIEVLVLANTFELLMKGLKEEYNQEIINFLSSEMKDEKRVLSVAQLSMVHAAQEAELITSKSIINPLRTLIAYIVNVLELERR